MNVTRDPKELLESVESIRSLTPVRPKLALILGSGLGNFASEIVQPVVIESHQIPHYPLSTVEGHAGRVLLGPVRQNGITSAPILLFQGRTHYYEAGSTRPITFPVRLAKALGVSHLIVTNAAGGIHRSFVPGQLMLIRDFLNLTFVPGPAVGIDDRSESTTTQDRDGRIGITGSQFDAPMCDLFQSTAKRLGIRLAEGVYCWLKGPSYETAAEIEMLSRCGADAVGMSTVPEVLEARRLGVAVAGLSLISNLATGRGTQKLSHKEVKETAEKVQGVFTTLMKEVLVQMTPLLEQGTTDTASDR